VLAELWYSKVAEIDDQGLFNILLLVELEDYGRRIGGKEPRPYMFGQIEYAVNFIHNIATKKEGIEVKLDFIRTHIKLKIILVERADAILEQGIKPYVDAVKIALDCVEAFYLIILQKDYLKLKNIEGFFNYRRLCKDLAMEIESLPGVSKHFEVPSYEYSDPNGIHREGKLIRYLVDLERTGNSVKL
jgi:hypothetical protein